MPAFDMCSAPYRAGMSVRQSRTRRSRFELRCLTNSQARPSDQFAEWQLANEAVQAADETVQRESPESDNSLARGASRTGLCASWVTPFFLPPSFWQTFEFAHPLVGVCSWPLDKLKAQF